MPERFKLSIELGNDAMQEATHIAAALRDVAERVENTQAHGSILDENGNVVGVFERGPVA